MADTNTLSAQRRTLAMAIDDTCTRLSECPAIPLGAARNSLTGGWIVVLGDGVETQQERWRLNADGSVREYTRRKLNIDPGKCQWDQVWWTE